MKSMLTKLSPSITDMIRMDHTHVLATFHQYEADTAPSTKKALVNTICLALEVHAQLEEEIFYPAMREVSADRVTLDKSVPEHGQMRKLIASLRSMEPTDSRYDATLMELMRDVMHHVADEETILLPEAERLLASRLDELGAQMTKRRLQLVTPRVGEIAVNTAKSMSASTVLTASAAVLAGAWVLKRVSRPYRSRLQG